MKILTKKYKIETFIGIKKGFFGGFVKCKYYKNDEEKQLKEKLDYQNYIKPLSEKPETLGE